MTNPAEQPASEAVAKRVELQPGELSHLRAIHEAMRAHMPKEFSTEMMGRLLHGFEQRSGTVMAMKCTKCGADRSKEPCKFHIPSQCAMAGTAQTDIAALSKKGPQA